MAHSSNQRSFTSEHHKSKRALIKFRFDISMKDVYEIELNRKRERIFNEFIDSLRFQNDQIRSRIRDSKGLESY